MTLYERTRVVLIHLATEMHLVRGIYEYYSLCKRLIKHNHEVDMKYRKHIFATFRIVQKSHIKRYQLSDVNAIRLPGYLVVSRPYMKQIVYIYEYHILC